MPRNGSGSYALPNPPTPFVAGSTIVSADINATLSDIAQALSGSVAADGQTPMTGTLNMNFQNVDRAGQVTAGSVAVSGAATFQAGLTASGYDSGGGNLRLTSASYGSSFRNDGGNTYLLLTNSGSPTGSFNALRPLTVNNASGAVTLDSTGAGGTWTGGKLTVGGGVIATGQDAGGGQFRMVGGSYGSFWRNDGTYTYLLLTNNGDANGGNNAFRPLRIENATGKVMLDGGANGLNTGGGLGVNGVFYSYGIQSRRGMANNTMGGNYWNFYWNGSALEVWVDNVGLGNMSISSDRRIKRAIQDSPSGALDRIGQLRPVSYRFADVSIWRDDGVTRVGFIADEVQQVIPSAVNGAPDAVQPNGDPQPQSLNPMPLIAELVAAVKELKAELDALKG